MTRKERVQLVVEQILNMYNNNVLADYGNESFECWCENGDVFDNFEDISFSEEEREELISCMRELAPNVDALTYQIEQYLEEEN